MSVIVFIGPTLTAAQAAGYLQADFRPPARQGDVYRACMEKPKVIAIIDGFFQSTPAVWHKEILYAMSQGIHVFGAASMGAIRAAELDAFGMKGIGEVYQQFATQVLEDDDEVAVTHAPEEMAFMTVSEAMVNIRKTLLAAQKSKVIDAEQTQTLLDLAKQTWYPQRSFSRLLTQAQDILPPSDHRALSHFIDEHKVDIKQLDAIALLKYLAENIDIERLAPMQVDYAFANTDAWDNMVEQVEKTLLAEQNDIDFDLLLLELKLAGLYQPLVRQARERITALGRAKAMAGALSTKELKRTLLSFAEQQNSVVDGQLDFSRLSQWLKTQRLDMAGFDRLMTKQGQLARLETACPEFIEPLLDILRLNHQLGELCERIESKRQATLNNDTKAAIDDDALWRWYFQTLLQKSMPRDLSVYAKVAGFADMDTMRSAVTAHYHWCSR